MASRPAFRFVISFSATFAAARSTLSFGLPATFGGATLGTALELAMPAGAWLAAGAALELPPLALVTAAAGASPGATAGATAGTAGATTGTITVSGHGYSTGDRIRLTNAGNSTITYNSAALSETAVWYAIVVNANSFKLATSHVNATAGTSVTLAGSAAAADIWNSLAYTYVVRDAPVPIGGTLKVIAGQKLVLEGDDSLFVTASSASSIDAIASILQAVS